ncbi:MAG: site-2 protease family protein [Spirochaetota bacterium]
MNYFVIILIVGLLILIHELGHFIFAKLAGIPISVFSIGFGPKLYKWKRKETEYRLSLIPLGGYIMPAVQDEKEFYRIPVLKRIFFTAGGPVANIILPLIVLIVMNVINYGISIPGIFTEPFARLLKYLSNILNSIPLLFSKPEALSGIVGIIAAGGQIINSQFRNAINLLVILSLNLAVFNMLPIPALDGGKILLYLLEKIHPKFLKAQVPVTIAGWVLLIGLMIYATVNDVIKLVA